METLGSSKENSSSFQGSQTELYLHLTDVGESQLVHRGVASGVSILELGCGRDG